MSFYQGSILLGAGLGPTLGGFVAELWGIRAPFFVFAVMAVVAALWALSGDVKVNAKSLDLAGYKIDELKADLYLTEGKKVKVKEHNLRTRSVVGFPGSETISGEDLLRVDVDVLIPAALEGMITESNANDIKA
ncbi:MFS transporter, partial [Acetomicrobium sp. S15 = DSM 107314]|uniref:MFS transporter n=1 Tax=Acetomicrobium sp. S15 = DSM 107314 TaxID=2529858 RepID=UPI001E348B71